MKYNLEIIAALASVLLLTAIYALASVFLPVGPSSPFGHGIGILGFTLMLATETLYSWRKTRQRARWGRTQLWLAAHIYTGIVGPYMVLLHTGFRFAGLAGLTFWLTVIVVCSGFVGRYVYAAIPRTSIGDEIDDDQLLRGVEQVDRDLERWLSERPASLRALAEEAQAHAVATSGVRALLGDRRSARRYRHFWQQAIAPLDGPAREQALDLFALLEQRRALQRQVLRASVARRILAIWHTAHVPVAVALFVAAAGHAVAALYYR